MFAILNGLTDFSTSIWYGWQGAGQHSQTNLRSIAFYSVIAGNLQTGNFYN